MIKIKQCILAVLALFLTCLNVYSQTYETIADGNWNDGSVWSVDGGITPCGCYPATPTAGATIIIRHDIIITGHIGVSGGYVAVAPSGSLYGPIYNLTSWSGAILNLWGPCVVNRLETGTPVGTAPSTVNIYGALEAKRVRIYAGTINVDGGILGLPVGNFQVYPNGNFITANGANLELYSGNITNEGYIYICETCCLETLGNWRNEATGVVEGAGSARTSAGNMGNYGSFNVDINWCSAGSDTGMPSTEDCASATPVCAGMTLPVSLVLFEGEGRGRYNEIRWETASEQNSDFFIIQRSEDGVIWRDLGTVKGAGNSFTNNYYYWEDQAPLTLSYYRLEQYDFDGSRYISYPIGVQRNVEFSALTVTPNPSTQGGAVSVTGVGNGFVELISNSGQLISLTEVHSNSNTVSIDISMLNKGMYHVRYVGIEGTTEHEKLIVQ